MCFFHDGAKVWAINNARAPAGDLILPSGKIPVVLVSVGVGITLMAAMLHSLVAEAGDCPTWFVHGAGNSTYHASAAGIRLFSAIRSGINLHIAYRKPLAGVESSKNYDSVGKVDGDLIKSFVRIPEVHYYSADRRL